MTKPLVMVTGAGSGIGAATARAFAAAGHPVLLIARRRDRLEALGLSNTVCRAVDVRDRPAVAAAVAEAEALHGPIDCLLNNAGIAPLARIEDQDPEEWRDLLDINCLGVMNCMHVVMPGMKGRRHGTIINVSSIAGRKSYPYHDAYGASKAYVHALTEAARRSMSAYDVRVIVVTPGANAHRDREHDAQQGGARDLGRPGRRHWRRHGGGSRRSHHALCVSDASGCHPAGAGHNAHPTGVLGHNHKRRHAYTSLGVEPLRLMRTPIIGFRTGRSGQDFG